MSEQKEKVDLSCVSGRIEQMYRDVLMNKDPRRTTERSNQRFSSETFPDRLEGKRKTVSLIKNEKLWWIKIKTLSVKKR